MEMDLLRLTDAFSIAVVVVSLVYDVVALTIGGSQATISARVVTWSKRYPAIPFALGFLAGHWFG